MTDTDTLTTEHEADGAGPATAVVPVGAGTGGPPPGVGRALDGDALWSGLKDGALILVAVFLAVVGIGYKAHQGSAGTGVASNGVIDVTLKEFAIDGNFNAPPGDVTFNITNGGTLVHDIVITGLGKTAPIDAGGTDTLVLAKLAPGSYEIFCDLPGHKASGMVTTLKVAYP
ncbi:MAG: cupredoxin domain-containing protein [Acidimicrobiales bacterium]